MIEYDPVKNEANIAKRGLPIQLAEFLFDGPFVEEEDARRDYGESRFVATGPISVLENRVFVVVYTWRGSRRRIVSFRKANDREVRKYHQNVA
jgi:uncharacterized DUF497 family protein